MPKAGRNVPLKVRNAAASDRCLPPAARVRILSWEESRAASACIQAVHVKIREYQNELTQNSPSPAGWIPPETDSQIAFNLWRQRHGKRPPAATFVMPWWDWVTSRKLQFSQDSKT